MLLKVQHEDMASYEGVANVCNTLLTDLDIDIEHPNPNRRCTIVFGDEMTLNRLIHRQHSFSNIIPGITHWHTCLHSAIRITKEYWDHGLRTLTRIVLRRKMITKKVKDYNRQKELLDDISAALWAEYLEDWIKTQQINTTTITGKEVILRFIDYAVKRSIHISHLSNYE
jgi:hypothetical protein